MPLTYEVRIYNISRIFNECKDNFSQPYEAYKLLTREEMKNPYCVYENLSKEDSYNYGHSKDDILDLQMLRMITKDLNDEIIEEDEEEEGIFVGVKVIINLKNKMEKIVDCWFE